MINPGLPHRLQQIIPLFQYGHSAVATFIVLSGFSLMLPIARSSEETLKGGMLGYLKRRSLRILPPYYVALGLSLLLIALVPGLHKTGWRLVVFLAAGMDSRKSALAFAACA